MNIPKKRCAFCHRWYASDPRTWKHQLACGDPACGKLRHAQADRSWRIKHPGRPNETWKLKVRVGPGTILITGGNTGRRIRSMLCGITGGEFWRPRRPGRSAKQTRYGKFPSRRFGVFRKWAWDVPQKQTRSSVGWMGSWTTCSGRWRRPFRKIQTV